CLTSIGLLLLIPLIILASMFMLLYILLYKLKFMELFSCMLFILIFLAFFLPFHSVIEEIEKINTNLNINILNQILYWLYLCILFSVIIFIHKSINDFAKRKRKIIDSYKHKYLITFNIIDDEKYKNGNFRLKKLYIENLNKKE
ncbi:hypothetical protein, partial [Persephonella sp.]